MIIYKATNLINGKVYVGKTIKTLERRKQNHFLDAKREKNKSIFHNALLKYGKENFQWEIIDKGLFINLESYWIKKLNCKKPNGYNLTDGGEGVCGLVHSAETCAKISKANKGRKHSLEQCAQKSARQKGHAVSPETRTKISKKNKGRIISLERREQMSKVRKGVKLPPEWKAKIRAALIGNKYRLGHRLSSETKAKMSASHKGHKYRLGTKLSLEHRAKLLAGLKAYWAKRRAA